MSLDTAIPGPSVNVVGDAVPDADEATRADARALTDINASPASDAGGQSRIARNVGFLMGGQFITWTMTALWTFIVPRELGPAQLGLIVSAISVSSILGIVLQLGFPSYLVRESVADPEAAPRLLGTALVLKLVLVPIMVGATFLLPLLAHYGHEARLVLYLAAAMTVFATLADPLQAGFQAIQQMKYIAYSNVINKFVQSMAGIALVLLGFRATGVMAVMAIVSGLVLIPNFVWLRRYIRVDLHTSARAVWVMCRESSAFIAASVFTLIYLWIDTVMLSFMTDSRVVGWYGAATTLFQTLLFVPSLVSTAALPSFVQAFGESREKLLSVARGPVEFVLVICIALAALTAMFAHVLLVGFYGAGFAHGAPVMVALAVCILPMGIDIVFAAVAVAAGRQRVWTGLQLLAAVVNPAINIVLIKWTQSAYHNGAIGAAWTMVLTELLLAVVGLFVVGRHVFDRGTLIRVGLMCVASGAMLLAHRLAQPLGEPAALAVGLVIFATLVLRLKIVTDEERTRVLRAVRPLLQMRPRRSAEQRGI
jgi:O-antigen/teichoic acid export membrane protein